MITTRNTPRRLLAAAAVAAVAGLTMPGAAAAQGQPAPKQIEQIGRGVVAMPNDAGHVYVGWRLLGNDADGVAFNVYRSAAGGEPVKLNDAPLTGGTNFVDEAADLAQENAYTVRPVVDGEEQAASDPFVVAADQPARPYLAIPIQSPEGYTSNDGSAGDLDGDGKWDLVIKFDGRARDNSHGGETDPPILHGYTMQGEKLWEINLGPNIRGGAHYTQFMVYDLDGDGSAEIVAKTSDGTVDGTGTVLGDASARHADEGGHILRGPEWLTVFSGRTGEALDTVDYVPARTINNPQNPDRAEYDALWGDDYGNRGERYLAGVAYLDGERPSVVMARGYYTRTALTAWDFRDGELRGRWIFDTGPGRNVYSGQGAHSLAIADVDKDGRDEIVYGAAVIDDDGTGLYSTTWGHGDALHVSDMDPSRPGLEIFMPHESPAAYQGNGATLRDARTGELLVGIPSTNDVGRGVAFDIDPRHPGYEMWATTNVGERSVYNVNGQALYPVPRGLAYNFAAWWDGDLLREMVDGNRISKFNWGTGEVDTLLVAEGATSNNGTKSNPTLSADLLGDWREEVIWRAEDDSELRIYTTAIPTQHRITTLMHDPTYRTAVAWQNVAYNQPPHPGFYIGPDMPPAPRPNVTVVPPGQAVNAAAAR